MKERQRLITEVEAIMIEQLGGIAPLDEETLARLEANKVKPDTASKKGHIRSEVVYVSRRTGGKHQPASGKR